MTDGASTNDGASTKRNDGIVATYHETDDERILTFEAESGGGTAAVAQNSDGYAMLTVRTAPDGDELERYYGFDMALDHVGERLGVAPTSLPIPDLASDMGM